MAHLGARAAGLHARQQAPRRPASHRRTPTRKTNGCATHVQAPPSIRTPSREVRHHTRKPCTQMARAAAGGSKLGGNGQVQERVAVGTKAGRLPSVAPCVVELFVCEHHAHQPAHAGKSFEAGTDLLRVAGLVQHIVRVVLHSLAVDATNLAHRTEPTKLPGTRQAPNSQGLLTAHEADCG